MSMKQIRNRAWIGIYVLIVSAVLAVYFGWELFYTDQPLTRFPIIPMMWFAMIGAISIFWEVSLFVAARIKNSHAIMWRRNSHVITT